MTPRLLSFITLGLSMLPTSESVCQNWAPIGAKWTFGMGWVMSSDYGYSEWTCVKDSLVAGQQCKVIQRSGGYISGDIAGRLITYQDSNNVLWYNTFINQFTVLYDFSKDSGDTWVMQVDTCDLLITVDSTGVDTINGTPLKTLFVSSENWSFDGKIVEGIGHLGRPTPDIIYHCYGAIEDLNYYTGLRC